MKSKPIANASGVVLFVALSALAADNRPMTNQDVVDLVKARLPESTVVMAVQAATPAFDTSANALIKLNAAGVPAAVVEAMIAARGPMASASHGAGLHGSSVGSLNPEEITLIDGDKSVQMHYLNATSRMATRALGLGGMGGYAVLNGPRAALRITNKRPSFMIVVPEHAQPASYFSLVTLAVRRNNTREIMVASAYKSMATGLAKDRIAALESVKADDQSRAPPGFVIYRVTPQSPLAPGEHAIVLNNTQIKAIGFFGSGGDTFFDFGVD